jgi:predicted nucleic acid-binding protein
MKNLFKGFNQPTKSELTTLWNNAVFVFDTNVLTNLYRYRSSTSEELLKLMEQLGDRVWIPYHVALEYQRNRLSVIHDQHKKFSDTKSVILRAKESVTNELKQLQLSSRHSHIEPREFIQKISEATNQFTQELNALEESSRDVNSSDQLLTRLESLFENKVGDKPDQEFIDKVENEGKLRFENKIPPGYEDAAKIKHENGFFTFGGVNYHRQYGDLIIWTQIIEYAKNANLQYLIFVTDDNKEDWWQITKGKTIGLRVELVDEIYRKTDVNIFHAYSSESFLHNANNFLQENISEATIEDVKQVSTSNMPSNSYLNDSLKNRIEQIKLIREQKRQNAINSIAGYKRLMKERENRLAAIADYEHILKDKAKLLAMFTDYERMDKEKQLAMFTDYEHIFNGETSDMGYFTEHGFIPYADFITSDEYPTDNLLNTKNNKDIEDDDK